MRVLITGGCGFIGKNFIHLLLAERPHWEIVNLDALTYAGTREGLPSPSYWYRFVHGDVRDPSDVRSAMAGADAVVHFAAESHVDRSILDAAPFVSTNNVGLQVMLDAARATHVRTFLEISTDEVYGTLAPTDPPFTEDDPLRPRSPYAASKAAQDLLCLSYFHTHGLDVRITRCCNNYGPFQFPEKLIPLAILRGLQGLPVPVYGDGRQRRDWIHVEDHCRALLTVLESGAPGEVYNIGAGEERENISVVEAILSGLSVPSDRIAFVRDRPGHDRRYSVDASRIRSRLGWSPRRTFMESLSETITWYRANQSWWRPLTSDAYGAYMRAQYGMP